MIGMELIHHGVKGQQWGVRHGPPYPVDPKNGRVMIRKGTEFKRLSVRDESVARGHAYVTYLKSDSQHYRGFFGARLTAVNKGADVYSITMKAKKDLLSPSKKERVDTFLKLYQDDPILRKELGRYYKSNRGILAPLPKKFYEQKFSNLKKQKLDTKGYETFVRAIGGNEYIRSEYFKTLARKGYAFVNDDLDGGFLGLGKAPSIIFEREKSVSYEGQEKVSRKEIIDTFRKEGARVDKTKPLF